MKKLSGKTISLALLAFCLLTMAGVGSEQAQAPQSAPQAQPQEKNPYADARVLDRKSVV